MCLPQEGRGNKDILVADNYYRLDLKNHRQAVRLRIKLKLPFLLSKSGVKKRNRQAVGINARNQRTMVGMVLRPHILGRWLKV
ncbi:hypothetical protein ACLOJK_019892 [Asimina triloba]